MKEGRDSIADDSELTHKATLNWPPTSTLRQSSGTWPKPGKTLAERFRFQQYLGGGGNGEIWQAVNIQLGVKVAIKLPNLDKMAPQDLERFRREARALCLIHSEHVLRFFEYNTDPTPYLVMELLRGHDLAEHIKKHGPLSLASAKSICRQLCAGLQTVHDAGIIHRDIKPSNIYCLGDTGKVKLVDFGIMKLVGAVEHSIESNPEHGDPLTMCGSIIGTPQYMSPEQWQVNDQVIAFQSDLWSLAVVLYKLLIGDVPFNGKTYQAIARATMYQPAPNPTSKRKDLPPSLDEFFQRALNKDPGKRFETALEMGEAFESIVDPTAALLEVIPSPRPSFTPPPRPPREGERSPEDPGSGEHAPAITVEEGPVAPVKPDGSAGTTTTSEGARLRGVQSRTRAARVGTAILVGALALGVVGAFVWKKVKWREPCASGTADCDGNPENGCEADLKSAAACGACGVPCQNPHGSAVCLVGVCVPVCAPGFADCNGDTYDGCETNMGSDALHCGSCSQVCGGEHGAPVCRHGVCALACDAGFGDCNSDTSDGCETVFSSTKSPKISRCAPILIASGPSGALTIAADSRPDGSVYWTNPNSHALSRVSKRGGPVTFLYGKGNPTSVALSSADVYWSDASDGTIMKYGPASPTPIVVAKSGCVGCIPFGVTVRGGHAFWTVRNDAEPSRKPELLSDDPRYTGTAIASGRDVITSHLGISADTKGLYWGSVDPAGGGAIWHAELGDRISMKKLVKTDAVPMSIAAEADGGFLYWASPAVASGDASGVQTFASITRSTKDGSSTKVLAGKELDPRGIATDDDWVYWTTGSGTVRRIRKDGSAPPETLASGQRGPVGIAVDALSVFWVNQGNGSVMKVSK